MSNHSLSPSNHATTLLKGLDTLSVIASFPSGVSMPDLVNRIGQPRSSTLRLVETLRHYGLVEKSGRLWTVTDRFYDWTSPDRASRLRERYLPIMRKICDRINELVMLGILEGNRLHHIAYIEGEHALRVHPRPSQEHGLETAAMGKLYLSVRPDLLPTNASATLKEEIERARVKGHAWNIEESAPGVFSVATWAGPPSAASPTISVAWPVSRFEKNRARAAVDIIRQILSEMENPDTGESENRSRQTLSNKDITASNA